MTEVYTVFIMGQGGAFTSPGLYHMASKAAEIGIKGDVFQYGDVQGIEDAIARHPGSLLAGVGYSLGISTLTWLTHRHVFDLALGIGASRFAKNYMIDPKTKRSVLWRVPLDPLSSAGEELGFQTIHDILEFHLLLDVDPLVDTGVFDELKKLKGI